MTRRPREASGRPDPELGSEIVADGRHGGVVFAATRVDGSRGRSRTSRVMAGAAALAAVGLVALGVGGRIASSTADSAASASGRPAAPSAGPLAVASFDDGIGAALPPIGRALAPPPVDFLVTRAGRQIEVAGTIGPHAISILGVAVVDATGHVQHRQALWVDDPDGGLRPATTRTFRVTFPIAGKSPSPATWVQVTAYDAVGAEIGPVTEALVPGSVLVKVPLKVNQTFVR